MSVELFKIIEVKVDDTWETLEIKSSPDRGIYHWENADNCLKTRNVFCSSIDFRDSFVGENAWQHPTTPTYGIPSDISAVTKQLLDNSSGFDFTVYTLSNLSEEFTVKHEALTEKILNSIKKYKNDSDAKLDYIIDLLKNKANAKLKEQKKDDYSEFYSITDDLTNTTYDVFSADNEFWSVKSLVESVYNYVNFDNVRIIYFKEN